MILFPGTAIDGKVFICSSAKAGIEVKLNAAISATALLDRLLHHAHVVNVRGQTYRLKDRAKAGIQTVPAVNIPAEG